MTETNLLRKKIWLEAVLKLMEIFPEQYSQGMIDETKKKLQVLLQAGV